MNGEAAALAERLAGQLWGNGDIRTPAWRDAFAQVPRHVFVPYAGVLEATPQGSRYTVVSGGDPAQRGAWLRLIYSDTTLVTQVSGEPIETRVHEGSARGRATSSSTAPGLMAWMLEALDIQDGHRVLEIGTGSGYNAALLCHRLGAENVTSIDIDPALAAAARCRLTEAGYAPTLHVGDGRAGYPRGAPYDRAVATCSLPYIPPEWIAQTRDGGLILTNIAGPLSGAMLLATVTGDTAEGAFLPRWAGFMWARPGFVRARDIAARDTAEGRYETRGSKVSAQVLEDRAFAFVAQLHLRDALPYWAQGDGGASITGLVTPDGSWAEVHTPPATEAPPHVEQGGPQRLWDIVEDAHTFWEDHGRPDWSSFGVTASPESQRVWLHSPDSEHTWELPTAGSSY